MKAKICSKCGVNKSLDDYRESSIQADGHVGWCWVCQGKFDCRDLKEIEQKKIKARLIRVEKKKKQEQFAQDHKKAYDAVGILLEENT